MIPFLDAPPRRVVVLNATGRYAARQVTMMREGGTPIVAGIALGAGGGVQDGVPLLDSLDELDAPADAAVLYAPPGATADAVRDCAAAGIRTIVSASEYVPVHDALRAARAARAAGCWLVGPNTLGLCVPGKVLLGSVSPAFCSPGSVAVLTRSGTLTLAVSRLLTAAGVGQSVVVHMGGDTVIGRNPHEYLAALADHGPTRAVLYVGEIGGDKEYALAEAISGFAKPVVAMIAGRHAPEGRQMGHAGALIGEAREGAAAKLAVLREAGAQVARTPYDAIEILKGLI
ncbi:CoA-binding protein [Muricoccus radiodurans]|uniref:CoA-binding protein n=1 Tax=Muricoccus radiodurans TaxID=2231721 RepID=UPI003CE958A6